MEGNCGQPKLRYVNRAQRTWAAIDVEQLIGMDHKARAIWDLCGQLDLSVFAEKIESQEGAWGRPAWDPRLLLSVWVYALSEGITKARELSREMEYEPGLRWLCGLEKINYHTLSDFISQGGEELKKLFTHLLAAFDRDGLIKLDRVMHDGTKVRAQAAGNSFRREKTLRQRLAQAQELVQEIEQGAAEGEDPRRMAARRRAAREREERTGRALAEVQRLQQETKGEEQAQLRASITDVEARVMKQADGGFAPSYNVQLSTEASNRIVVGVEVTQAGSDYKELQPAVERMRTTFAKQPKQVVADGGFTSAENVVAMAEQQIDMIGSLGDEEARSAAALKRLKIKPEFGPKKFQPIANGAALQCPAGKRLEHIRETNNHGWIYGQYRADGVDCRRCPHRADCCPRKPERGRLVSIRREPPELTAFRKKMETEEAKKIYRQRAGVAETPNAWIKARFGLRQFRLRGLAKVRAEAILHAFAYNAMQWMRLRWRPALAAAM